MDLQQIIDQAGGLGSLASELGIDEGQASNGIKALLPAVLSGFATSAQGGGSAIGALAGAVEAAGGKGLIDNVLGNQPTKVAAGHDILGHIFGSQAAGEAVADHAASQNGLDAGVLQKLLPVAAMLAAGYMSHSSAGSPGGLAGALGSLVGAAPASGGGLGGMLGSLLGGGTASTAAHSGPLGSLLDQNGDGSSLDDILGLAGKLISR